MEDAFELDGRMLIDEILEGLRAWSVTKTDKNGGIVELNIQININPNSDFSRVISASCIHDGSLFYQSSCLNECLHKIFKGEIYDANYGEPRHNDTIGYTIGNPVALVEPCEFETNKRPLLCERTTVMLPLAVKIIR